MCCVLWLFVGGGSVIIGVVGRGVGDWLRLGGSGLLLWGFGVGLLFVV